MQKLSLFCSIFFSFLMFNTQAQDVLWGATSAGGTDNGGTLFYIDPATDQLHKVYEFRASTTGSRPMYTQLVEGLPGKLYGLTSEGGSAGKGVLFEYEPASNDYRVLHHFTGANGAKPLGSLYWHNNLLYGMTSEGGLHDKGTIFSLDPASEQFVHLHDFDGQGGAAPHGALRAYNGLLYGMCYGGGSAGKGILFTYDPASQSFVKKLDFIGPNGARPYGHLTEHNGQFYGLTSQGGVDNLGTIFQWVDSIDTLLVLKSFYRDSLNEAPDGAYPKASLTSYNGKLYGLTSDGGIGDTSNIHSNSSDGVLFEFHPDSLSYIVKHHFSGEEAPQSTLTIYNNKLYATGPGNEFNYSYPGYNYGGFLFEWDPSIDSFTLQKHFSYHQAQYLTQDTSIFYPIGGITFFNGKAYGLFSGNALYEWDITTNQVAIKQYFGIYPNGRQPHNSLVYYQNKLYGTAKLSGPNGLGVVFSYDPLTNIYTSTSTDYILPHHPIGNLVPHDGKLLGLCRDHEYTYPGFPDPLLLATTLFQYQPANNSITRLGPHMVQHSSYASSITKYRNNFYFSFSSQFHDLGGVMEYNPFNQDTTVKHSFSHLNNDGIFPKGDLIPYKFHFYLLTENGGSNSKGTLTKFRASDFSDTTIHHFSSVNGAHPTANIEIHNGIFYGTTRAGGQHGRGVLFSYAPGTGGYQVLHHFDSISGAEPWGSLCYHNGRLYGLSRYGGVHNKGTAYYWDIAAGSFTKIADFDGANGAHPIYTRLTIAPPTIVPVRQEEQTTNLLTIYPSPAHQQITIELEAPGTGALRIFNALGQLVYKQTLQGEQRIELGVAAWAAGRYQVSWQGKSYAFVKY